MASEFDAEAFRDALVKGGIPWHSAEETAKKTAAGHRLAQLRAKGTSIGTVIAGAQDTTPRQADGQPFPPVTPAGVPIEQPPPPPTAQAETVRNDSGVIDLFGVEQAPQASRSKRPSQARKEARAALQADRSNVLLFKPLEAISPRQRDLLDLAFEIEQNDAQRANAVGYMARTLAQATLPHTDPKTPPGMMYWRTTGKLMLSISPSDPRYGIPFGSIPRVLLAWICTEAVRTKEPTLYLGKSQSEFLSKLNLKNSGYAISRFREQSLRLFKSTIGITQTDDSESDESARLTITNQAKIFWKKSSPSQEAKWDSSIKLTQDFFEEILSAPVPLDIDVYHALSKSPLAMDIYSWLTYRIFVLRKSGRPSVQIPWTALKLQFGSGYADDKQGLYDFKANFKKRLREVLNFYPEARDAIQEDKTSDCLKLYPCALHIKERRPCS